MKGLGQGYLFIPFRGWTKAYKLSYSKKCKQKLRFSKKLTTAPPDGKSYATKLSGNWKISWIDTKNSKISWPDPILWRIFDFTDIWLWLNLGNHDNDVTFDPVKIFSCFWCLFNLFFNFLKVLLHNFFRQVALLSISQKISVFVYISCCSWACIGLPSLERV